MELLYTLIEIVAKSLLVFVALLLMTAYNTLFERKVLGHIQVRYGPNRVGPFGLLQPIADGIKAFFKEDLVPARADGMVFMVAPAVSVISVLCLAAVIPFGNDLVLKSGRVIKMVVADVDIGLLYIFAIASIGEFGVVLGGWASGNKYGITGALRAAAQMISYEVFIGLAVIGVLMISQTLNLREIVLAQSGGFWHWNVFLQPVAFLLYFVGGLAELARVPFDMPEAESELACGFNIEFSSMKFALYFISEYAHMIIMPAVAVTLFWGGFLPVVPALSFIPGWIWFLAKVSVLVFVCIWIRATYPRLRYDQIMKFGWKFMFPLALLNVLVTGVVLLFK
ncbi:MAG: NADH-quinone oxidoreductase subunit NuoH [Deltaproteobacteria bacterium]|nr:NADH-quinone oxidoreductase subunit NuoH [Deltaproteobacteria bacterium]MBW2120343.1 NADH-quinone oxidoreductase subunit NuoH [Deltaproteobacteria bacterium]